MLHSFRLAQTLLCCSFLAGCVVGPDYQAPAMASLSGWLAPVPHDGDVARLADWWQRLGDPVLPELIAMAELDSPTLTQAWGNITRARATLATSKASALPSLNANASGQRGSQQGLTGETSVANTVTGGLDASWEIDLFGKAARSTEAAEARVEARTADWHEARVSLAAEVANTYVQYKACRLLVSTYEEHATSQNATAKATELSVRAGFASSADGTLSGASAAAADATLTQQRAECDLLVKSLVALTGVAEPQLRALLGGAPEALPKPESFTVDAVPASLLAQRPDVASLERELAAASAEIGQAEANRYPSLSLLGSVSRNSGDGQSSSSWSFGPSLSLPLFDGGRRRATVYSAQATYDSRLAQFRQGIRSAVKEVEQALVRLDSATRRTGSLKAAAEGYRQHFMTIDRYWREGGASLLTREEARRVALQAEVNAIAVQRDQVESWITLYKAIGGGWHAGDAAVRPASGEKL